MIAKIEKESKESDKLILDTLGDQYDAINSRFAKAKQDRDSITRQISTVALQVKAVKEEAKKSAAETIRKSQPTSN